LTEKFPTVWEKNARIPLGRFFDSHWSWWRDDDAKKPVYNWVIAKERSPCLQNTVSQKVLNGF